MGCYIYCETGSEEKEGERIIKIGENFMAHFCPGPSVIIIYTAGVRGGVLRNFEYFLWGLVIRASTGYEVRAGLLYR